MIPNHGELEPHGTIATEANAVYAIVAVSVLTIYDHILTVSQEVEYVWRRKFTAATVLFLANKYLALVNICLMLQITWNDSVSMSFFPSEIAIGLDADWLCTVGIIWYNSLDCTLQLVHAIFNSLWIRAIWNRKWQPSLLILILSMATLAYTIYRVSRASVLPDLSSFPLPIGGCLIDVGMSSSLFQKRTLSAVRIFSRAIAIATDAIVIAMTWLKTYGDYKSALRVGIRPTVTTLLLRDGTLYFGALFVVNAIMLGLNNHLSRLTPSSVFPSRSVQVTMLLFVWPTAINTIVLSRFVLNLRSAYWAFDDNNTCLVQVAETITRIVGVIGEGPVNTCDGHQQTPTPTQNYSSELFTDINSVKY